MVIVKNFNCVSVVDEWWSRPLFIFLYVIAFYACILQNIYYNKLKYVINVPLLLLRNQGPQTNWTMTVIYCAYTMNLYPYQIHLHDITWRGCLRQNINPISPTPKSILGITRIITKAYQATKFNQKIYEGCSKNTRTDAVIPSVFDWTARNLHIMMPKEFCTPSITLPTLSLRMINLWLLWYCHLATPGPKCNKMQICVPPKMTSITCIWSHIFSKL